MPLKFLVFSGLWMLNAINIFSQHETGFADKFRQLEIELPTPNTYRTASGAPGHEYWQMKADYDIQIKLDDDKQQISGTETISYHNESPDELSYLWLQLDQNLFDPNSDFYQTSTGGFDKNLNDEEYAKFFNDFDGGYKILEVKDIKGGDLPYTIVKTMMRVDLPQGLKPGATYQLRLKWWYNINDRMKVGGRSGYEYFEEDGNYLYTIAQFYPRMVQYNEVNGWQHKQFLGSGEFTLSFGDYKVAITVPADQVIAATGVLQNSEQVLTAKQRQRLKEAETAADPVFIITPDEAIKNESSHTDKTQTWIFTAENVRDFAFASSRKFIWDAMVVKQSSKNTLAMSFYPKEGNPLWEKYSTRVVAHTLQTYSKYTFDYPYPVAISVHARDIGMEYPMICFNFGRPDPDGTYTARVKYGMLGVIIHEVGHNYFPMIINSDERQWSWMDEGLNSFLQYLTEQEWERGFPSKRGPAYKIADYMNSPITNLEPIMTNSESILQFGNNAYGKPAAALNILRETVLGRELFDFAFKTYAKRWMFKHPTPADFFRTMEDASGVDLDWYWRGWFFSTDKVDISIESVKIFQTSTEFIAEDEMLKAAMKTDEKYISNKRNAIDIPMTKNEKDPGLNDYYTGNKKDQLFANSISPTFQNLNDREKASGYAPSFFYEITLQNKGGLVMPIILFLQYTDGSEEIKTFAAEIWRKNNFEITKVIRTEKEVASIELDPYLETADTDRNNNSWPPLQEPTRFDVYKKPLMPSENPMRKARGGSR